MAGPPYRLTTRDYNIARQTPTDDVRNNAPIIIDHESIGILGPAKQAGTQVPKPA
jgi:hypothetical protein